jgi:N-acetyl-gamma-glutamyl-phosphate reductase
MTAKISVGIVGAAGYTGGELIRLLQYHPKVNIAWLHSRSNGGKHVSVVHDDLIDCDLVFTDENNFDADVVFTCLGHGESKKFFTEHTFNSSTKIIDLANDFRLKADAGEFIYGLPELNIHSIKTANKIANPGCFATAIQLGLLPLASKNLLSEVYTTGITGSTGAGQSLSATGHFSWRNNNIQAYKTLTHQHLGEIGESIMSLQSSPDVVINFVPWRGDFTRGIFVSSTLKSDLPLSEIVTLYKEFYQNTIFTHVLDKAIHLKQVVNTNHCVIHLEKNDGVLVVHSAIDNLLKGASGQAIQNMNIMCGFDENEGLKLKAAYF